MIPKLCVLIGSEFEDAENSILFAFQHRKFLCVLWMLTRMMTKAEAPRTRRRMRRGRRRKRRRRRRKRRIREGQ